MKHEENRFNQIAFIYFKVHNNHVICWLDGWFGVGLCLSSILYANFLTCQCVLCTVCLNTWRAATSQRAKIRTKSQHRSHSLQIEVKSKSICVRSIAFSVCRLADATEYYCCLFIIIIIECAECTSITFDRCVWPSARVYGAAFCICAIICRFSFVNWEKFRSKLMVNVRKSFELCGRF